MSYGSDPDVKTAMNELSRMKKPAKKKAPTTKKSRAPRNQVAKGTLFMTIEEVMELLPFSMSTLWRMVRDGRFPAPRKMYEGARATFWVRTEVDAWVKAVVDSKPITDQSEI